MERTPVRLRRIAVSVGLSTDICRRLKKVNSIRIIESILNIEDKNDFYSTFAIQNISVNGGLHFSHTFLILSENVLECFVLSMGCYINYYVKFYFNFAGCEL